ncbi:MAG: flagellar export chaperone FlgN [Pseudomonadota bacterium]
MSMKPERQMTVMLSPADIAKVEAAVDHAINVAEDLISVAQEENRRLKSGRPSSIEDLLDRKQKLANELESFLKAFKAQSNVFLLASPKKFTQLQVSNERLTSVLSENSQNLTRALTANRRRVETIMRAIREKQNSSVPYGNNGRSSLSSPYPVSIGRRYEA